MYASLGVMAATVSVAGYDACQGKEDFNSEGNYFTIDPESFTNIYDSSVKVEKTILLEEKCKDSYVYVSQGSGVLLQDSQSGEHYIITVEHVTSDTFYDCEDNRTKRKIKVLGGSIDVEGFPAMIIKKDKKADLALLKIEGTLDALPYHGRVGSILDRGDYVMGIGFPNGEKKYFIANVENKKKYDTFLNVDIIHGNSGGGVYRIQDDVLELVGLVRTTKTATSLERLQKFLQDTVLEDDYLR